MATQANPKNEEDKNKSSIGDTTPGTGPTATATGTQTATGTEPTTTATAENKYAGQYEYKNGQWYDREGNPVTTAEMRNNAQGKGTMDKGKLREELLGSGYDPNRVDKLVEMLMANAATQPSLVAPEIAPAQAGKATAAQAKDPSKIGQTSLEDVMTSGVGIGNTEATTREVQDEELVGHQLGLLLDENGPYIQRAKQRAMEMSNARGQLGSSFAAGAAARASIDAAMPIATADAQAFRDAATQNMNALNEFALANLQRATQLELGVLDANTRIKMANLDAEVRTTLANLDAMTQTNIANLDAKTRTSIANMQSQTQVAIQQMTNDLQMTMQSRSMTHEVGMEQLQQTGRVELAKMDVELQTKLKEMGFEHDFNMNELDHEQQLAVNAVLNEYDKDRMERDNANKRKTERSSMAGQAMINYTNKVNALAGTEMDAKAAAAAQEDAWNWVVAEFEMINSLYPELDPIVPTRG